MRLNFPHFPIFPQNFTHASKQMILHLTQISIHILIFSLHSCQSMFESNVVIDKLLKLEVGIGPRFFGLGPMRAGLQRARAGPRAVENSKKGDEETPQFHFLLDF